MNEYPCKENSDYYLKEIPEVKAVLLFGPAVIGEDSLEQVLYITRRQNLPDDLSNAIKMKERING